MSEGRVGGAASPTELPSAPRGKRRQGLKREELIWLRAAVRDCLDRLLSALDRVEDEYARRHLRTVEDKLWVMHHIFQRIEVSG